jgi:hypothetical protein
MPLQNRVTPFGAIVRSSARGTLMGNRGGCFHDERQELTRSRWKGRRWIACLLEFRGRWRPVMQPRLYTELFFLDEATALAAGHRPCAQCRWDDYNRFKSAWLRGNPGLGVKDGDSIDAIDMYLHRERIDRSGRKVVFHAELDALPDGVIVALDESSNEAFLVWNQRLLPWSFEGYGQPRDLSHRIDVAVLTPQSAVAAIAAGYVPGIHASVEAETGAKG